MRVLLHFIKKLKALFHVYPPECLIKKTSVMAEKLVQFYDEAQKMGGLKAKIRLAVITNIPSPMAATLEDAIDHILSFEKAMEELRKEFK